MWSCNLYVHLINNSYVANVNVNAHELDTYAGILNFYFFEKVKLLQLTSVISLASYLLILFIERYFRKVLVDRLVSHKIVYWFNWLFMVFLLFLAWSSTTEVHSTYIHEVSRSLHTRSLKYFLHFGFIGMIIKYY